MTDPTVWRKAAAFPEERHRGCPPALPRPLNAWSGPGAGSPSII